MISIIIPTLNEEKHLSILLKSIKNQDFEEELEIIIADAGSRDKTREIAKEFGCQVVRGGLPAKGRNIGAKNSKGELLFFMDADISLPRDFFKKVISEFEQRKLGIASFLFFPDNKLFLFQLIFGIHNFWVRSTERIIGHGYMGLVLTRRETHQRIQGFDEDIKLAEDHLYVRKARRISKYGIIKRVKVQGSVRRYEKDGIMITCSKYILAGFYTFFLGPIKTNIFKYRFNHYHDS